MNITDLNYVARQQRMPPTLPHACSPPAGDGWSARAEDAVLHGCIPFVIMDNTHAVFESILDWDTFSIRIKQVRERMWWGTQWRRPI